MLSLKASATCANVNKCIRMLWSNSITSILDKKHYGLFQKNIWFILFAGVYIIWYDIARHWHKLNVPGYLIFWDPKQRVMMFINELQISHKDCIKQFGIYLPNCIDYFFLALQYPFAFNFDKFCFDNVVFQLYLYCTLLHCFKMTLHAKAKTQK